MNGNNCSKCGRQISTGDKFCQGCGSAVETNSANYSQGFVPPQGGQGGFGAPQDGYSGFNSQQGGFNGFGAQQGGQGGFGAPQGVQGGFGGQPNGFCNPGNINSYQSADPYDEKMQKYAFISSFFAPTDHKYLEQLTNYIEGRRCKFNWAAAFFAGPWMAFRKMNLKAYLYTLLMGVVIGFAALILLFMLVADSLQYLFAGYITEEQYVIASVGIVAVMFGFFLYFGFCGYKIYFNRLSNLFNNFRNVDRNYMPVLHNKYGGTSPVSLTVYIVIMVVLNYITNY